MDGEVSWREQRFLHSMDMTHEEWKQLSLEDLQKQMLEIYVTFDPKRDENSHEEAALAQKREGEARDIARLQPLQPLKCLWSVNYTGLEFIDPETKLQDHCITICENPQGHIMGHKTTHGMPTVDDVVTALQVAMAFPLVGKGKRPYEVLVTRRLRNMWPQLKKFLHEIEIVATLETRKAAMLPSVDHALVMEAQSSPVSASEQASADVQLPGACEGAPAAEQLHTAPEEAPGFKLLPEAEEEPKLPKPPIPIEQLKLEGNQFYALQQYVEAADRYSEALAQDPRSAVLYSNRAIAYLQLGLHAKALADAEEAIRLNPKYIKGYARKGLALEKLGRVADARAHYRGCIFTLKRNECFKTALQRMETNNL